MPDEGVTYRGERTRGFHWTQKTDGLDEMMPKKARARWRVIRLILPMTFFNETTDVHR